MVNGKFEGVLFLFLFHLFYMPDIWVRGDVLGIQIFLVNLQHIAGCCSCCFGSIRT